MEQTGRSHKGKQEKHPQTPEKPGGAAIKTRFLAETMAMGPALAALEKRIERGIAWQGRYFVSAPAEMAQLGSPEEAGAFAHWHHWMFVCHLGGENYEFFEAVPGQELY